MGTEIGMLSSGLDAFRSAQGRIDQAAGSIAASTLPTPANSDVQAGTQRDLTDSLVQLKVGEVMAQAGARVIQTADDVLGTNIDTYA